MHTKPLPFLSVVVLLSLMLSLMLPTSVLADDIIQEEPTPEETTSEEAAPAGEAPEEGDEAGDSTPSAPEIVETLSEEDLVLVDAASGEPIVLGSEQAEEIMQEPIDPFIIRGGTTYSFTSADCDPLTAGDQPCSDPIQKAIDFSLDGEVIFIEPGVYVEQLEITKSITLQSTAPGVVIQSPNVLVDSFPSPGYTNKPIVYVHGADNVNLIGLTIDGDGNGNGNYRFIGIGYYNAGGMISDSTIMNITDTPFSGSQHGLGIYAYVNDGNPYNLVIDGNIVENYQKNGITLVGTTLTVEVTDNTVTGAGPLSAPGSPAQNGIQLSGGTSGLIQGNTVTGNNYDVSSNWISTGILLYGAGEVDVLDNFVDGNDVNLYLIGGGDTLIDGNTFSNGDWDGIYVYGTANNVTITNNLISGNEEGLGTNVVDESKMIVENNEFSGNTYGLSHYDAEELDATGNYWGCPGGPDDPACDTVVDGNVLYDPWKLISPFFVNKFQINSMLSCDGPTILTLPGAELTIAERCDVKAMSVPFTQGQLPGSLPDGWDFVSAFGVGFYNGNQDVTMNPGTSMQVEMVIPPAHYGAEFAILYWDPAASGWVSLPVEVVDDLVTTATTYGGLFVLVTR